MKLQSLIASVLDAQNNDIAKKPIGLLREMIDDIPVIENFTTIITGIRRCGKSTLMLQTLKKINEPVLYLNFEDIRLSGFTTSDFNRLNIEIEKRQVKFLFFDEIQIVEKWEVFINQKLNEGYFVFITGSNASLLSIELGTHLTGRHLSLELYPFSYNEFLLFNQLENNVENFDDYLQAGGMPEFVKNRRNIILQQLVDDILFRDVAIRYNVKNVSGLRELTVFLVSNSGKTVTARKLTGLFGITANSTVSDYFGYLKNSYLVDFIPQFDFSVKAQSRNPKKVYATDLGVYQTIKTTFTEDYGRQLEIAVFLHLRRKHNEIFYFNKHGECDFVIMTKGKVTKCIQVCWQVEETNMKREIDGLKSALDFFGLNDGVIVTHDQTDLFEIEGISIKLMPAWKYMISE